MIGSEHFVADVEVIVRIAAALAADDAVIGIGGGVLGRTGTEGRPDFHALEDEVHSEPVLSLHSPLVRADIILLAYPVLGPFHRNSPFAGERIDPAVVFVGPFPQHVLCDGSGLVQIAEEVDDVPAGLTVGYGRE